MKIGKREIGLQHPPDVIAEMSANHNGRIETAFQVIQEAKAAGADAVKIQTYRPATMTLECDSPDFLIKGTLREGKTLYKLYEWAHTPWEWHAQLFELAKKVGLIIFNSPFDTAAVELLEDLNAPAYIIASFEAVDLPLNRSGGGPGDSLSLRANELSTLTRQVRTAWNTLGKVDYGRKSSEMGNVQLRRLLYFVKNMSPGEIVTPDSIRSI